MRRDRIRLTILLTTVEHAGRGNANKSWCYLKECRESFASVCSKASIMNYSAEINSNLRCFSNKTYKS